MFQNVGIQFFFKCFFPGQVKISVDKSDRFFRKPDEVFIQYIQSKIRIFRFCSFYVVLGYHNVRRAITRPEYEVSSCFFSRKLPQMLIRNKDYAGLLANPKMQNIFQDEDLLKKIFALNKKLAEEDSEEIPHPEK